MENSTQKPTSIFPNKEIQFVKDDAFVLGTSVLLGTLLVIMVVLKLYIYKKDPKRDGT